MKGITPCLWFKDQGLEAAKFYIKAFGKGRITSITRYDENGSRAAGRPVGSVMTVAFRIGTREFLALNGGPIFKFTPAVSLIAPCRTQKEVDRLWKRLISGGGAESQCGWLTDKFGLSWQVVPDDLENLTSTRAKSARVMKVVLGMRKLDVAAMRRAAKG